MTKIKKKLTRAEEFDILKLVIDKFLWAGVIIMLYGLYSMISAAAFSTGLWIMFAGALLLVLLMVLLIREYEVLA
jgi:CHASE2 domain-containing sensor protein